MIGQQGIRDCAYNIIIFFFLLRAFLMKTSVMNAEKYFSGKLRILRGFFTNECGKYTFDIIGIFVLPSAWFIYASFCIYVNKGCVNAILIVSDLSFVIYFDLNGKEISQTICFSYHMTW